ncbi:MAG: hypothetical protein HFG26_08095 [Provencibacterium sp.]|nr:hypothetical protein [Provencibacterium sp.]
MLSSLDGISLVQTAEGALTELHDMLNRRVDLAGKSANGAMEQLTNANGNLRRLRSTTADAFATALRRT